MNCNSYQALFHVQLWLTYEVMLGHPSRLLVHGPVVTIYATMLYVSLVDPPL